MSEDLKVTGKARLFLTWMDEGVDSLLDIGCASSFMLNLLGQKSKKKFGLDFDREKLMEGKRKFINNHYICGSGEQLPFKDGSIDVITFFETLEHVENERKFVSEIHRVLKPDGAIMLSVPNKGAVEFLDIDNVVFTPILWILKKMGFLKNVSDYYLRYHRHYSQKTLEQLFSSRFKIEKIYYGGLIANQLAFLLYKSLYLLLLSLGFKRDNRTLQVLHSWMDRVTSWDFDHSYGRFSDKLSVYARKVN
jgi:ubiquinone/menaquinone biosynthesis C-methylase UbiE